MKDTVLTITLSAILIAAALGFLSLIGVPLYMAIVTDGHVQYCYVETETHQVPNQANVVLYRLVGFRPWRTDRYIALNLPSLEATKEEADRIGCQIK